MPKIIQLSPHVANLIAAGEVVERPASVIKELLENAVDAGASQIIVEIRDGGMTFLRVTDNGCGMNLEDAKTAFLRHATSKLRNAEDLAAINTMGFRGEALAAIASVSRIDLMTKTAGAICGASLTLEAGNITDTAEAGCPEGTTIIVRDLFFNTPARMKFMKSDTVEGSKVTSAVQMQALAHPEVSFRYIKDGIQTLSTPGNGDLQATLYSIYGKECSKMAKVESKWDNYTLTGYVSRPTDARPSRSMQTFFVNNRPVKSRLLVAALEEAYRNQIMVGKFPACVLHLMLPSNMLDVNVHPAKTEVKFLNEKSVFDCIHYGVLGALNKIVDRPQVQFKDQTKTVSTSSPAPIPVSKDTPRQQSFFQTMTPATFKQFTAALQDAPAPKPDTAAAAAFVVERSAAPAVREPVSIPLPIAELPIAEVVPQQETIPLPEHPSWRFVGELYHTYIIIEQGEDAFLIDKHAAHERILFEKMKSNQEKISSQTMLIPLSCRLNPDAATILLTNRSLLDALGFDIEEFGDNTVLVRQIPMDISQEHALDALEEIAADLLDGRQEDPKTVRDELLHTIACKAAIKAGWNTSEKELLVLAEQVMAREDLKYCPHGRPICVSLSKKQLEKQFRRT